jgi:hypothetical protein
VQAPLLSRATCRHRIPAGVWPPADGTGAHPPDSAPGGRPVPPQLPVRGEQRLRGKPARGRLLQAPLTAGVKTHLGGSGQSAPGPQPSSPPGLAASPRGSRPGSAPAPSRVPAGGGMSAGGAQRAGGSAAARLHEPVSCRPLGGPPPPPRPQAQWAAPLLAAAVLGLLLVTAVRLPTRDGSPLNAQLLVSYPPQ